MLENNAERMLRMRFRQTKKKVVKKKVGNFFFGPWMKLTRHKVLYMVSPRKHVELWNLGTFKLHGCSFIGSYRKRHPETAPTPFYEDFKTQQKHS